MHVLCLQIAALLLFIRLNHKDISNLRHVFQPQNASQILPASSSPKRVDCSVANPNLL